jgi:hypothetical protein
MKGGPEEPLLPQIARQYIWILERERPEEFFPKIAEQYI